MCALLLVMQVSIGVEAQEDLTLYATSAVLLDAKSGRVLYAKNADEKMACASTTKIMTCILLLEHGNLDEEIEVSSYAASMPKVKLFVKKGEKYIVRDLLFSLMLESHNDSAVVLAEYIGKQYLSEELKNKPTSEMTTDESKQALAAFAKLMNEKAIEIGCENTYFITPNGLDATETITMSDGQVITKEHGTTATELAKIMSYCITRSSKRDLFLEITRTPSYCFGANGRSFSCTNHNAFLNMMDGALSGKTGFTNKAGYCYVGALERDDRYYVVALLACGWPNNKTYKWSDTKELMQYGIDNFYFRDLTNTEQLYDHSELKSIVVHEGQTDILGEKAFTNVAIGASEGMDGMLMMPDENVSVQVEVEEELTAPVYAGTRVGTITYSVGDILCREEEIIIQETIEKIDFLWCMKQVLKRYVVL